MPDERLYLHDRRPGSTALRRIVRRDDAATGELDLSDVAIDVDWLKVDARRLDEPMQPSPDLPDGGRPGDWLLEIGVEGTPTWGRTSGQLTFSTGLDRQPRAGYDVIVQLRPPVNLSVKEIVLDENAPTTLLMSMRPEYVGQPVEVATRPKQVEARLEPFGERRYKLHVDWKGRDGRALPDDAAVDLRVGEAVVSLPVRR